MSDYQMYPQAYLLHFIAHNTPADGPKDVPKPLPLMDPSIKISRFGLQKPVTLAKLKGIYFPEAAMSAIFNSNQNAHLISKFFLNIENHKLSTLVPEVRLYKVAEDGSSVKPFYFPIVSDYKFLAAGNQMDLSSSFTSNAAVIESFSVTYTGKNPFQTSRSFLEANLTIKVDNISIMFDTPSEQYAPLADLFTIRSATSKKVAGSNKAVPGNALENGKNCKVIATLGYTTPLNSLFSSKERKVLKNMFQVIGLHYSNHDLKLEQDGSASINVKYNGYLEALKGESQFDLISSLQAKARLQKAKVGGEEDKEYVSLETFMTPAKKEDPDFEDKANSTTMEEITIPTVGDIMAAFGEIINSLYTKNKINIIEPFDASSRTTKVLSNLERFTQDTVVGIAEVYAQFGSGLQTWFPKRKDIEKMNNPSPFEFTYDDKICYVAFGDLLDAYYERIVGDLSGVLSLVQADDVIKKGMKQKVQKRIAVLQKELEDLNVLMADILYTNKDPSALEAEQKVINIADIPISIDTFYSMVFEEIVETKKPFYDMNNFITSFVPKLLTRSFNELAMADVINPITFKITMFTSSPLDQSNIAEHKITVDDVPSPLLSASITRADKTEQYVVIHQEASSHTRPLGKGDEEVDLRNGIFHLRANQNSGVIKNITFSRLPSPAREAYMITRNGKLYDELRFAHQASINMVGNNLLYPGTAVYVNPESLGFGDPRGPASAARKLGFGGYYTVGPVETKFNNGELTTSATLYFESFPSLDNQQLNFGRKKKKKLKDGK